MTRFVRFASTIWSVIRSGQKEPGEAIDALTRFYREPVRRYFRAEGVSREDAEDLVQELFLRIFEKDLLQKVEEAKGKFRSFLLGVANNLLRDHLDRVHAKKRGGDAVRVPMEDVPAADEPVFTREWMLHLTREAIERLMESPEPSIRRDVRIFRAFLRSGPSYAALADEFGVTVHAIKNALYETKRRIRDEVGNLVNAYTCSPEDFQDEMEAFDLESLRPPKS
jgi:RNA polymerase sigma-70 factor (ECF subfamily)